MMHLLDTKHIKHILWPLQYQKLKFCFTFLWEGLSETIFTFFVSSFAQNVFVTESRCVHLKQYIILSYQLILYLCYMQRKFPYSKCKEIIFCIIILRLSLDGHAISKKKSIISLERRDWPFISYLILLWPYYGPYYDFTKTMLTS